GEAKEADLGIAGGNGYVVLFRKGTVIGRIPADEAVDVLIETINRGDF
ncbi:MAG: flavodoxin-dependent (E)-4-hydroxy-3-methylbut-2-enyl-diphosphate synthase, partial [Clostridia bacterium]|nr:flavodoxin-dependent (E)-4-hydroxy-3-methylbut-2-enyl-diphosphate synthase [Clostridia bacterium]